MPSSCVPLERRSSKYRAVLSELFKNRTVLTFPRSLDPNTSLSLTDLGHLGTRHWNRSPSNNIRNQVGRMSRSPTALFSSDRFLAITVNPWDFGKIRVFPFPGFGGGAKNLGKRTTIYIFFAFPPTRASGKKEKYDKKEGRKNPGGGHVINHGPHIFVFMPRHSASSPGL